MDYKKFLLAWALVVQSPLTMKDENSVVCENTLYEVLHDSIHKKSKWAYYTFAMSQELLQEIDTMCLDTNCPVVFNRSLEDLWKTPLFMRGTSRHIGAFLWYDQYDFILKKYNNDTIPDSVKQSEDLRINTFKNIKFPLIYDEINTLVPNTLEGLLKDERFAEYRDTVQHNDTLIVVMKQANGKHALLYYETGKLILGTYATIGRGKATPRGLFRVDYKMEYKRSNKYNNAAMPYALHVTGNIFIHQWKVSFTERSHGCNRIPWFYAEALYYLTTAPKIDLVNKSERHTLNSTEKQLFDSLQTRTPQVLIVD